MATTTRRTRGRTLGRHEDTVTLHADPARERHFAQLLSRMRASKRDEASGFDAYWESVAAVLDGELYVYGGYDTPDAFIAREVKLPRRTALRMVRVARYCSPKDEARFGAAILDAAIAYVEARAGGPTKGRVPVDFGALRLPVVRDGKTVRRGLDTVTHAEIAAATRALRTGTGVARLHRSPAEQTLIDALAGVKSLADTAVHVSDGQVRFGRVPLYALADLASALRGVKLVDPVAAKRAKKQR